jgi:hypothetical protein
MRRNMLEGEVMFRRVYICGVIHKVQNDDAQIHIGRKTVLEPVHLIRAHIRR